MPASPAPHGAPPPSRPPSPGPAIISGGSSGIGLACAARLAALGHPLVLLARGRERLEAAADQLRRAYQHVPVTWQGLDVRDRAACAEVVQDVTAREGAPAWLVTCAGIAEPGLFLEQPLDTHIAQMEANYFGTLHLVHSVAPHMAAGSGGRIVLVSSGAGLSGIFGYAAYAPSKFAVRGLAEVLRVELAPHGISVTVAYPPDTRTPQLEAEEATKPYVTRLITAGGGLWEPDAVAALIIDRARAGQFCVAPGLPTRLLAALHSLGGPWLRARQSRLIRQSASGRRR